MKVVKLENIKPEHGEVFYMRKYTCDAILDLPTSQENAPIFFSIETSPIGKKIIEISFLQPINYPLIPVKKALIEYILTEELEGRLPC
ncbi:MAG: hypothetical protein PUC37_08985 [Spirochaetales bacterium]|nr:hypothetical protein [Spirochaetales bacterium]